MSTIFCPNCAWENPSANKKCSHCNCRLTSLRGSDKKKLNPNKSRIAAGVLALLIGGFGVHKFYCGHIGFGILYLLFFWTFIPAIIALIEGILYLTCQNDELFTQKYCV